MAYTPASHVRRPYVGRVYESDGMIRLADLAQHAGRIRANAAMRQGDVSAQTWNHVGQTIAQGARGIREDREAAPRRAFEQRQMQRADEQYTAGQARARSDQEKAARLQALLQANGGQRLPSDVLLREFGPDEAAQIDKAFDELFPKPEAPKTREIKRRNADGSEAIDIVEDKAGQTFTSAAPVEKPEKVTFSAPTPAMVGGRRVFVRSGSDGKTYDMRGQVVVNEPVPIPPVVQGSAPKDKKPYIRNGEIVYLASDEPTKGDVPYSADAMQGVGGESSDARATRTAAALNSIDKLKTLAPKRLPGLPGMVQGAAASVAGTAGYNTQARQYNALLQPTAMQMAVAIQGAAGLSNSEREAMATMLGSISTMDYESQMALLENASEMIRGGADVDLVTVKDPKTKQDVQRWVPRRSRMRGALPAGTTVDASALPSSAGATAVPELPSGLKPNQGVKFKPGHPFAGQTWMLGPNGTPVRVPD